MKLIVEPVANYTLPDYGGAMIYNNYNATRGNGQSTSNVTVMGGPVMPWRWYTWGRLSTEAYTSKYSSMRSPTSMRVESGMTVSTGRSYWRLSSTMEPPRVRGLHDTWGGFAVRTDNILMDMDYLMLDSAFSAPRVPSARWVR